jgi:hypothetical protein
MGPAFLPITRSEAGPRGVNFHIKGFPAINAETALLSYPALFKIMRETIQYLRNIDAIIFNIQFAFIIKQYRHIFYKS